MSTHDSGNVKKISPYPIDIKVFQVEGQPGFPGKIWKMSDVGFIMKVEASRYYKVGDEYLCQFVLPVIQHMVKTQIKVIKTYDVMEQAKAGHIEKVLTVEMHFRNLSPIDKKEIRNYLVKSGQGKEI